MTGFARYLESLVGSWEALAAPHPGSVVLSRDDLAASMHPNPVLNNAIVLSTAAVDEVQGFFGRDVAYAVWCRAEDTTIAEHLRARGFRRDITTRPMLCDLGQATRTGAVTGAPEQARARPADGPAWSVPVRADADPGVIAELNGVEAELLRDVPGIRAYATPDDASGLVLLPVGSDVHVSFVATRPADRRRGLARAVTRAALADARRLGFTTASLQATPVAEALYASLGFQPVGRWQEWVAG